MRECVRACVRACARARACLRASVCVQVCVSVCVCFGARSDACMHVYRWMRGMCNYVLCHTRARARAHTHTRTRPPTNPHSLPPPCRPKLLRAQIEYYFSEVNLCTDYFLRKKMDINGFVLVATLLQFHRMELLRTSMPCEEC